MHPSAPLYSPPNVSSGADLGVHGGLKVRDKPIPSAVLVLLMGVHMWIQPKVVHQAVESIVLIKQLLAIMYCTLDGLQQSNPYNETINTLDVSICFH